MVKTLFITASKQHVGKTTVSLSIMNHYIQQFNAVGYIKPIGQKHVLIDGVKVDKDVKLFQRYFNLSGNAQSMSPVVVDSMMTRRFIHDSTNSRLRQKNVRLLHQRILDAYTGFRANDFNLIEGTGHTGVGSVMGASNARVAKLLNSNIIMVINGGIGNTIDQFELNHAMCKQEHANIIGVVVNKVLPCKYEQTQFYIDKYLRQYNIPLIGTVPYLYGVDDLNDVHLSSMFSRSNTMVKSKVHYKHIVIVDHPLVDCMEQLDRSDVMFVLNGADEALVCRWFQAWSRLPVGCAIVAKVDKLSIVNKQPFNAWLAKGLTLPNTQDVYLTDADVVNTVIQIKAYTVKFSTQNAHQIKMVIDHYSSFMDFDKIRL